MIGDYSYRISKSNLEGKCEVCGEYTPQLYYQVESRTYETNDKTEGETYSHCFSYFGHENCLHSKRRNNLKAF